eukprot:scaffold3005_cov109-Isochrysis_galbana.AAC.1
MPCGGAMAWGSSSPIGGRLAPSLTTWGGPLTSCRPLLLGPALTDKVSLCKQRRQKELIAAVAAAGVCRPRLPAHLRERRGSAGARQP